MTDLEVLTTNSSRDHTSANDQNFRLVSCSQMAHVTEVHAYVHILKELTEKKGWKKDQIYTQNEIQNNKLIKEQLGQQTPENIVEISPEHFYVIEAKSKRSELEQAIKEACNDYADIINKSSQIKAFFASGVAGNEKEGYITTSKFLQNGKWETITENDVAVTALLSKTEMDKIILMNDPNLKDVEISEEEFLQTAEELNGILHENAIHKDTRAKFISAVLLALARRIDIDLEQEPVELVNSINTRVDLELRNQGKPDFSRFIHLDIPSSSDNHIKYKNAIVKTVQTLYGINVGAMMKSGKDLLGHFYEVFLKYGNGAKEIGIVLTPRHITRFAAEVMDVQYNDIILDPTCGTGGFLVAAFDEVKKKTSGRDFDNFTKFGLYGIEEQDPIIALALVNMIFRGDGKNNMIEGNCFSKWLNLTSKNGQVAAEYLSEDKQGRVPPITKVLMNPPFPKKKTDTKAYRFIEQALEQMQNGGTLFSVLPYSAMIKGGAFKTWRENLLKKHTLLAVVTFPAELFSPVAGVRTVGIFVRKGVPHQDQKILWIRALHDGLKLKKGKRLPNTSEPNDIESIKPVVKAFLKDNQTKIENIPEFLKVSIYSKDKGLELCPEAYLDSKIPETKEIEDNMESLVRQCVAYVIKSKKELNNHDNSK